MKVGMYVKVPMDINEEYNRYFALGQVSKVMDDNYIVILHDNNELLDIYEMAMTYRLNEKNIKKAVAYNDSECIYNNKIMKIINSEISKDDYNYYLIFDGIKYYFVCEADIKIPFYCLKVRPINQIMNQEFHNPIFFLMRNSPREIYKQLEFSSFGFKELFSSRVYLFKHQIDTIIKALKMDNIRLMLADEVGLGKTVQAAVILKTFLNRNRNKRALIVVPEHLLIQWKNELYSKFWINVENQIYNVELISIEDIVKQNEHNNFECYDFVIIDEVHNYLSNLDAYFVIKNISNQVRNILLLSATPIQNRVEEYRKLLTLLEPSRFENISSELFDEMVEKQDKIRESIYQIVYDIDSYVSDDFIREDIDSEINKVVDLLGDQIVDNFYIEYLNEQNLNNKLKILKKTVSYVSYYYQFERRIIRHRKLELKNSFAKRTITEITTNCEIEAIRFSQIYELLNILINRLLSIYEYSFDKVKLLISSFFSSPQAFKSKYLEFCSSLEIRDFDEKTFLYYIDEWIKECEIQIANIEQVLSDPERISFKMLNLIDYLDQNSEFDKIVVIFDFSETLELVKSMYSKMKSINSYFTVYSKKQTILDNEYSIKEFQENDNCRILFADYTAGEGKNLQKASKIINFDLCWSPATIEQRIGRLDRIGRNKDFDVESVVFFEKNTIEEEVFELWNNVFNVYKESLSGLEIILKDVEKKINYNLKEYGLIKFGKVYDEIDTLILTSRKFLDKERLYDIAKQLDPYTEAKYERLISSFSNENQEHLERSLKSWGTTVGFKSDSGIEQKNVLGYSRKSILEGYKSLKNSLFPLPDTKKIWEHTNKNKYILGTLNRDDAINNESLVFYSPGEPIFDSLFSSSINSYKGRTTTFKMNSDYEAELLYFRWNIEVDLSILLKYKIDHTIFEQFLDIVTKPTFSDYEFINGYVPEAEMKKILTDIDYANITEIRKLYYYNASRSSKKYLDGKPISEYELFRNNYPLKQWSIYVKDAYNKSHKKVKKEYLSTFVIDQVINQIEEKKIAIENSNKYFNITTVDASEYSNIISMLVSEPPFQLTLDSTAFIKLENRNDL